MSDITLTFAPTIESSVERIRRTMRSLRVRAELAERRRLVAMLPRKPELNRLIDEGTGYGFLPSGAIPSIAPAVTYARKLRNDRVGAIPSGKKSDYNPTIHAPKRYEDAPAFLDLALSDEILQIASDYLGEVPVLLHIKLWCTPVNDHMKGSQLYHRDGNQWTLRRAKFMINMDDVDAECGPFTFLPADVSERISNAMGSMAKQRRVKDDETYQIASRSDAISLVGPAGTGCAVDSSRCFHHGARVKRGERLLLMFHFLRLSDAMHGGQMFRSPGFDAKFGNDPIRRLAMPNGAPPTHKVQEDD